VTWHKSSVFGDIRIEWTRIGGWAFPKEQQGIVSYLQSGSPRDHTLQPETSWAKPSLVLQFP
jgi:hypothetical protein